MAGGIQADLRKLAASAAQVRITAIKASPPEKSRKNSPAMPHYDDRPSMSLTSKQLPAVDGWDVGQEKTLLIRVQQTSKESSEYTRGVTHAGFRVTHIACLNEGKKAGGAGGRAPAKS